MPTQYKYTHICIFTCISVLIYTYAHTIQSCVHTHLHTYVLICTHTHMLTQYTYTNILFSFKTLLTSPHLWSIPWSFQVHELLLPPISNTLETSIYSFTHSLISQVSVEHWHSSRSENKAVTRLNLFSLPLALNYNAYFCVLEFFVYMSVLLLELWAHKTSTKWYLYQKSKGLDGFLLTLSMVGYICRNVCYVDVCLCVCVCILRLVEI